MTFASGIKFYKGGFPCLPISVQTDRNFGASSYETSIPSTPKINDFMMASAALKWAPAAEEIAETAPVAFEVIEGGAVAAAGAAGISCAALLALTGGLILVGLGVAALIYYYKHPHSDDPMPPPTPARKQLTLEELKDLAKRHQMIYPDVPPHQILGLIAFQHGVSLQSLAQNQTKISTPGNALSVSMSAPMEEAIGATAAFSGDEREEKPLRTARELTKERELTEGEKEEDQLVLQVIGMSKDQIALLRAGVIPPDSPAMALVGKRRIHSFIERTVRGFVQHWQSKGVHLRFEDIFKIAEPSFALHVATRKKWDPARGSILTYSKRLFKFFLQRCVAKENELVRQYHNAEKRGKKHPKGETHWQAAQIEVDKHHLRPIKEFPRGIENSSTIWDKLGADEENPHLREQVVLAVAHAILDWLRNPHVSQRYKEIFLLRRDIDRITQQNVGNMFGITKEAVRQQETRGLESWRHYLKKYLAELDLQDIIPADEKLALKVLREFRTFVTRDQLARVMVEARFSRSRWKALVAQLSEAVPPVPRDYDPETILAGIKTESNFVKLTYEDWVTLSDGREHFVIEGHSTKRQQVYRPVILDLQEAGQHFPDRFSVYVERKPATSGKDSFTIVQSTRGRYAFSIAANIARGGVVRTDQKLISGIQDRQRRTDARRPKDNPFKSVASLPTMTRSDVETMQHGMERFFFVFTKSALKDLVGFDAVSPEEASKKGPLYSKIEVYVNQPGSPFPYTIAGYSPFPSRTKNIVKDILLPTGLFTLQGE